MAKPVVISDSMVLRKQGNCDERSNWTSFQVNLLLRHSDVLLLFPNPRVLMRNSTMRPSTTMTYFSCLLSQVPSPHAMHQHPFINRQLFELNQTWINRSKMCLIAKKVFSSVKVTTELPRWQLEPRIENGQLHKVRLNVQLQWRRTSMPIFRRLQPFLVTSAEQLVTSKHRARLVLVQKLLK